MLIPILAQCLEPHRRLVVPGLGAFIVKEPGRCVVFTELLKRDDGILRQALIGRGVDESEVADVVGRFVAEVRRAVGEGNEIRLPGLGILRPGANGTVAFVFDPAVGGEQPAGGEAVPVEPVNKEPYSAPTAEPVAAPSAGVPASKEPAEPAVSSSQEPSRSDKPALSLRSVYEERPLSASARMSPDPAVKGLRYSKPLKTTDAYTYVGQSSHRHHHRHHRHHRRSRGWLVWVVAALAILIAGGTLGYHFLIRPWLEQRELDNFLRQAGVTTSVAQPAATADSNVSFLDQEAEEL